MKKTVVFFLVFSSFLFSQQLDLYRLEEEIYQNNRVGKHQLSQEKLLTILGNQNLSYREQVKLNLLMAATFRSINDYGASINYLKKSKEIANHLDDRDSLKINIAAEMAFAYFDNNNYRESEKIIKKIAQKKYLNLDESNKAYIIMQQGYIHFLHKKYALAEKEYENSLAILKKISPCNQPAVLVKQMQLYSAGNRLGKVDEIYQKCSSLADSCKILKYKIYAVEEAKTIYQSHNDKDKVFLYNKLLDSLNEIYNRDNNLSDMHVKNEDYLEQKNVEERNFSIITIIISAVTVIVLIVLGMYFYRRSKYYKKEKRKFKEELEKIKEELKIYSQSQFSNETKENDILNSQSLNNRQKELLRLVAEGFTNKEIAAKLSVTEATVKYHIRSIYSILDIKNRKEVLIRLSKK